MILCVTDDKEDQEVGEGDRDVARTVGEQQQNAAWYGWGGNGNDVCWYWILALLLSKYTVKMTVNPFKLYVIKFSQSFQILREIKFKYFTCYL